MGISDELMRLHLAKKSPNGFEVLSDHLNPTGPVQQVSRAGKCTIPGPREEVLRYSLYYELK